LWGFVVADFVVLKRLTEKSDLGWFRSIFRGRSLKGRQKSIILPKAVINDIWPNLQVRQDIYEASKKAMKAALKPGGAGKSAWKLERANADIIGRLPVYVDIYGPGAKPMMQVDRIIKLLDKNWRLNGAFIDADAGDPARFDPLQEGDVAIIGFDGLDWPTAATVILLAEATDTAMWADLAPLVTKRSNPMISLDAQFLQDFADKHNLPIDHIIRRLFGGPVVAPPVAPVALPGVRKPRAVTPVSAADRQARSVGNDLTGFLGEKAVDAHLSAQLPAAGLTHIWMWPTSAEHPYDFEVIAASGAPDHVIDAKTTSSAWTSEFHMSSAELAWAAHSPVPYYIYRVSDMTPGKPSILRISNDIRAFAMAAALAFVRGAVQGTRAADVAISPDAPGLTWSGPVALPPILP
jgi:hypothetical protein